MFEFPNPGRLVLATALSLATLPGFAAEAPVEYSADAVLSSGNNQSMTFKTFVGKDKVRTETEVKGQHMVQIVDTSSNTMWILNSQAQSYTKSVGAPNSAAHRAKTSNPCENGAPGLHCKALGSEMLNGRKTAKWRITRPDSGNDMQVIQWVDEQRLFPVRIEHPTGVTELKLLGKESVNGRSTERWEMTNTSKQNDQKITATQWYDPELRTAVREQMPGGMTRELRNIKIGPQSESLFMIPDGYTLATPKARSVPGGQ